MAKSKRESAARKRYWADNRCLAKKQRNVLKSSHGKWTYEELVEHGKKRK